MTLYPRHYCNRSQAPSPVAAFVPIALPALGGQKIPAVDGLGERLKRLREGRGETQAQLATAIESDAAAVSRWERGLNEPQAAQIRAIVKHYGVSADYLLLGDDTGPAAESEEFKRFLATEYGQIARRRGWLNALLALRLPVEPTAQIYKDFVHSWLSALERKDAEDS